MTLFSPKLLSSALDHFGIFQVGRLLWARAIAVFFVALLSVAVSSSAWAGGGGCGEGLGNHPCFLPIVPTASCATPNEDGSFTATLGFATDAPSCCNPRSIAVGNQNQFFRNYLAFSGPVPAGCVTLADGSVDCGQPTSFPSGLFPSALTVTWDGQPFTWTLRYYAFPTAAAPGATPTPTSTPFPFFSESTVSVVADAASLCPGPPVCNAGGSYSAVCSGTQTVITLDGSASSDPDSDILSHQWAVTCSDGGAILENSNSARATLRLLAPGTGTAASCVANLTVTDGVFSVSCSANVSVPACNLDCLGQPNGVAQLDRCGVCNGSNSCIDCAGVPFGGKKVDRCGVCDGNGLSCLGCDELNQEPSLLAVDGGVFRQKSVVRLAALRLRRADPSRATGRYVRSILSRSQIAFEQAWRATYSLPSVAVSCANDTFCSQSDNSPTISLITQRASDLRSLGNEVSTRLRKAGQAKRARSYVRAAETAYQQTLKESGALAKQQSNCSAV